MARILGVHAIVVYVLASASLPSAHGKDSIGGYPIETQHAECTLISGDVRATAEASVSRKLEGFCATDHLSRAFGNLEYRLLNEINHLKAMLNLILPPPYQQHYFAQPQPQLYESPPTPTTEIPITPEPSTTKAWNSIDASVIDSTDSIQNESPLVYQNVTLSTQDSSNKTQPNDDLVVASTMASATEKMLHFRPVQKKTDKEINKASSKQKKIVTGPRDFEIHKFNNTILLGGDLQIFTYYWKIEQFSTKLKENVSILNSPIFSISGLNLRVDAYLNHLDRDFLFLQLHQIKETDEQNERSNVILKTGDLFKTIETKVMFKHTITILNQVTSTNDLKSQELENTIVGFLVPNSAILSGLFAKNDSVFIKVVIRI